MIGTRARQPATDQHLTRRGPRCCNWSAEPVPWPWVCSQCTRCTRSHRLRWTEGDHGDDDDDDDDGDDDDDDDDNNDDDDDDMSSEVVVVVVVHKFMIISRHEMSR